MMLIKSSKLKFQPYHFTHQILALDNFSLRRCIIYFRKTSLAIEYV